MNGNDSPKTVSLRKNMNLLERYDHPVRLQSFHSNNSTNQPLNSSIISINVQSISTNTNLSNTETAISRHEVRVSVKLQQQPVLQQPDDNLQQTGGLLRLTHRAQLVSQ